jgi:prepilin-type processing-associated H-X9-DG protein
MYLDDNKGMWPGDARTEYSNAGWGALEALANNIPNAVRPDGTVSITLGHPDYISTTPLLLCPSAVAGGGFSANCPFVNYGWNDYVTSSPLSGGYAIHRSASSIKNPSQIMLMADSKGHEIYYWDYSDSGTGLPANISLRHQSRTNLLFADGHAGDFGTTIGHRELFY